MKARFFAFAALMSILCSCAGTTDPVQPNPLPKPSPGQFQGPWLIHQLDDNGRTVQTWEVSAFRYSMFKRTVEFKNTAGQTIRLTRSFRVEQKPKP